MKINKIKGRKDERKEGRKEIKKDTMAKTNKIENV